MKTNELSPELNVKPSSDVTFKEVYSMIRVKKISYLLSPAIAIYF